MEKKKKKHVKPKKREKMKKICGKKKDKTKKTNKTKKKNTWCGESSTSFRVLVNKRWGLLLLHWVFFFNKSIISIKTYKKLAYKTSRHHHPYLQNFNRHLAWTYIYIYIYIYVFLILSSLILVLIRRCEYLLYHYWWRFAVPRSFCNCMF